MNIGEMQRKLSLWAEQDRERRFYDLYNLLCGKDWLRLAHDHVRQNAGSVTAGCDGIVMKDFDEDLEGNLLKLQRDLEANAFEPYPVRRVLIPKPDGKRRPLGIPSIRDRIVQEATRMVLEPIYEADFSQYSYGFRPNRRTMDAIRCITWFAGDNKGYHWIIEGDISSYFDTINHRKLLRLLRRRVEDEKFLDLVWRFLRAGVMEGKLFKDTKKGTPQGGILSPVLANVYLHELDRYMERYTSLSQREKTQRRQAGLGNYIHIRYADDFVILTNATKEQTLALKEELKEFLKEKLCLTLSEEKTKVTHINDGFEFLGFWIERSMGQKGMTKKILIPKGAQKDLGEKIARVLSDSLTQDSVTSKFQALNKIIQGWCHYYKYTSKAGTTFHKVEHKTFWKVAHWLAGRYRMRIPNVLCRFAKEGSFVYQGQKLIKASSIKSSKYTERFLKGNPYIQMMDIQREELTGEMSWMGHERRPGMSDLIPQTLARDNFTCQSCGETVARENAEVDHKRPVHRFKRPVDANRLDNLQTLCKECHKIKTQQQRVESRVHSKVHARFGGRNAETYR